MAEIIPVRPEAPDEASVRRTADALLNGETVALPTDTIYGLCALAENPDAIEALYKIKGRGEEKGAPVLIGELLISLLSPIGSLKKHKLSLMRSGRGH